MEQINAKSIFSPATGFIARGGFDWTCNPYLGCTFACTYCYAAFLPQNRRPIEDWGKLLGDVAAVTAMLDRLLHHGHILKCGPRSWRTKLQTDPSAPEKP